MEQKKMQQRQPWYKRQYLVELKFQSKVAQLFLLSALIGMFSFATGWLFFLYQLLAPLKDMVAGLSNESQSQLFYIWNRIFILSLTVGFLSCLCLVCVSFFFSNKVAGPIFRLDKELKSMLENGRFEPIKTRQGDHFREHVDMVNSLILRLKNKD